MPVRLLPSPLMAAPAPPRVTNAWLPMVVMLPIEAGKFTVAPPRTRQVAVGMLPLEEPWMLENVTVPASTSTVPAVVGSKSMPMLTVPEPADLRKVPSLVMRAEPFPVRPPVFWKSIKPPGWLVMNALLNVHAAVLLWMIVPRLLMPLLLLVLSVPPVAPASVIVAPGALVSVMLFGTA